MIFCKNLQNKESTLAQNFVDFKKKTYYGRVCLGFGAVGEGGIMRSAGTEKYAGN